MFSITNSNEVMQENGRLKSSRNSDINKYSERFGLKNSLVYKSIFHLSSYRKYSNDTDSNTFDW